MVLSLPSASDHFLLKIVAFRLPGRHAGQGREAAPNVAGSELFQDLLFLYYTTNFNLAIVCRVGTRRGAFLRAACDTDYTAGKLKTVLQAQSVSGNVHQEAANAAIWIAPLCAPDKI